MCIRFTAVAAQLSAAAPRRAAQRYVAVQLLSTVQRSYGCGSIRDWDISSDLLNSMNFGGYSQVLGRYSAGLFAVFGE